MIEKNSIKAVLWNCGYIIAPTLKAITEDLGVNTTESIQKMDKPVIK